MKIPPPLPEDARLVRPRENSLPMLLAGAAGALFLFLILLRVADLLRPFTVPSGGMAPTIMKQDSVIMEGLSYLRRAPRRGDIVVFNYNALDQRPGKVWYAQRIAGEPGDRLRISENRLYVNGVALELNNKDGPIRYSNSPRSRLLTAASEEFKVPAGCYLTLGDNTDHSFDGRFFGVVPAQEIIGRIAACYWPPGNAGRLK